MLVRTGMYHFEVSCTTMYRVRYVLVRTSTYHLVLPCTRCTGFQMSKYCQSNMSKIDPCILFYIFIYLSCLYTSGTPIFSICLVYTMYIPDIWECHQYVWYIGGISMYIHGISNGVDIYCISKDIPCISIEDIHGISLYKHGISEDVYTWYIRGISMFIPGFVCLDLWAGPCCWSQLIRHLCW